MATSRWISVLALALILTACSSAGGDRDGHGPTPSASAAAPEAPAALDVAWTSSGSGGLPVVVTDDLLVFVRDRSSVLALDRLSGEEVSRWRVPPGRGTICSASAQLGRGHLLGLLLRTKGQRCTIAVALDVRTGEQQWRRVLPSSDPDAVPGERDRYHEGEGVAVGDRVLLATTTCSEVRRLSLADGRVLGVIAPRDSACRNDSVTDGQQVAILDFDPERLDEGDPFGLDFYPAREGRGAFALYDADSGRRLWVRSVVDHTSAAVDQLVSSDPVVLTTTTLGLATTSIWGADGTPGPFLGPSTGRQTRAQKSFDVVGQSPDTLVVTFPESAAPQMLHAYDLTTGQERWQLLPPGVDAATAPSTASVVGDRLVVAIQQGEGTDLLGYDLADPGTPEVLGRAEGSGGSLVGDLLLDTSTDATTAYRVPAAGEVRAYAGDRPTLAWSADDLRPEDAVGACDVVGMEALDLGGLAWGDLPTPVDCTWRNDYRPGDVQHGLEVSVGLGTPGPVGDDDPTTAVQDAQELAEVTRIIQDKDGPRSLEPLASGLGDEAWGSFGADGSSYDAQAVRMVTRWRNVVVSVRADQKLFIEQRAAALVPYDRLQDAVYAATADVLEGLGAEPTPPARGTPGPSTEVGGGLCRAVEPALADLVAVEKVRRGAAGGDQQRTCAWYQRGEDVYGGAVVVVDAVPGAPDGTSATERARQVARLVGGARRTGSPVDGFPGATTIGRFTSDDGTYRRWEVTSVVDNLVVWVHVEADETGATPAEMDAATQRMVQAAVATAR